VEGGAGAHLIVIRDNPKIEIPETTLEEAAQLAALASYQKEDSHARVIGTEVRYVKKSMGMSLGHVEVLKVQYSLLIKLDPSIEDRLRIF
jgi:predicted ribosome quality control (RQC) complex YloA/Tae2 family protein